MSHRFWVKIFTAVVLMFSVCSSHGLTLKSMRPGATTPLAIQLHDTKRTTHALAVRATDGMIHYADMTPIDASFPGGMFVLMNSQIYLVGTAPKFIVTTTPNTRSFSFTMSAQGTFTVNWGDGEVQEIVRDNTESTTYTHDYGVARAYTIGFDGKATGYSTELVAAISFRRNLNVGGIRGSLGAIFSTIGDGNARNQQPNFGWLFNDCINLSGSIPQNLFTGVHGQPFSAMFEHLFDGCHSLTGSIPENLFAGIQGHFDWNLFTGTFSACYGLTGSIPNKLFAGLSGQAFGGVFWNTFNGCSGLTGNIPDELFGNISGPAQIEMFKNTFRGCTGLTGPSAKINGKYLYEIWSDATATQVGGCYNGATGLSDYGAIPAEWK